MRMYIARVLPPSVKIVLTTESSAAMMSYFYLQGPYTLPVDNKKDRGTPNSFVMSASQKSENIWELSHMFVTLNWSVLREGKRQIHYSAVWATTERR